MSGSTGLGGMVGCFGGGMDGRHGEILDRARRGKDGMGDARIVGQERQARQGGRRGGVQRVKGPRGTRQVRGCVSLERSMGRPGCLKS